MLFEKGHQLVMEVKGNTLTLVVSLNRDSKQAVTTAEKIVLGRNGIKGKTYLTVTVDSDPKEMKGSFTQAQF